MDKDKQQRAARAVIGLLVPVVITVGLIVFAPPGIYLWVKAVHVAAAVTWIGGMLGLTYLLSWQAGVTDPGTTKLLGEVEKHVLQGVVNPAMVVAWGVGLWLGWDAGWFVSGWLQAKLVLVVALSALHGWVVGAIRAVGTGTSRWSAAVFRHITLAGALVALGVIVLAIVKPM